MDRISDHFADLLGQAAERPSVALMFLRELWPALAGAELARRSEPLKLTEGKTLVVAVEDQAWERAVSASDTRRLLISSINRFWKRSLVERIRVEVRQST